MTTAALHDQRRDRTTGVIATVVLHALLLLLFLFVGLTEYDPPLPEETVEVAMADFGTDLAGSGNVETPDPGDQSQSAASANSEDQPEEVATDEASDVEVNKPRDKPREKPKDTPKPTKPKEPTISTGLQNALNQWGNTGGGGQSGEGSSDQSGNEGVPSGVPDGLGTFHGNGWDIRLGGRGLARGPKITDKPSEGGKVVLNIFVDRTGKVTRVTQNLDKSTTTSQTLFNIARKAAMACAFTPKPDAAAEQKGEMTFVFILE
ncbi:MAG: hypothetical protein IPM49_07805 [Flavobacteriales bacterium]|nr:hypothetical protein [Flavobacteriales bacterium]